MAGTSKGVPEGFTRVRFILSGGSRVIEADVENGTTVDELKDIKDRAAGGESVEISINGDQAPMGFLERLQAEALDAGVTFRVAGKVVGDAGVVAPGGDAPVRVTASKNEKSGLVH